MALEWSRRRRERFVEFADFHVGNTCTITDFKLLS
jgi:hypothetical protein